MRSPSRVPASRRERTLWLLALAVALAVALVPAFVNPNGPRVLKGPVAFSVGVALMIACLVGSAWGLVLAHRDDLAEFGVMSAFFLTLSVLPLVHGTTNGTWYFTVDRTTVAATFWALPIALGVAAPLLALRTELVRKTLVRWKSWTGAWLAAVAALCLLAVAAPGWLLAPAAGTFAASVRGLVCFGLCVVLSLRHLRLAELSRKDRCLVVSLSFLLIGTMSLRWMMPESFAEDFWAQAGSTTFAVEIGLALTAALFAGRGKVREVVRPIAAWDPAEAFELGLDPVVGQLVEDLGRKDEITRGHVVRTATLSIQLAEHMNLAAAEVRAVALAALLHDVGKLEVPDAILTKPGPLTDDEWVVMRRHPEDGARIVTGSPAIDSAAPAVLTHHERWDGTGYPACLSGQEIPYVGRIVAVCDAVDAMAFTRQYREGKSLEVIAEILRSGSGGQWDPTVVAAMLDLFEQIDDLPDAGLLASVHADGEHELEFCVPDDPRPVELQTYLPR